MTTSKLLMMIVTAQVALDSIAREVAQSLMTSRSGSEAGGEVKRLVDKHLSIDEGEEAGLVLCAHLAHLYHLLEQYRVSLIEFDARESGDTQMAGTETVQ